MPLDRILGLGAIVLAVPVGLASWGFEVGSFRSPGAGFWPFLVSLCIAGLGAVLALRPDRDFRRAPAEGSRWWGFTLALCALAGFTMALEPAGYVVTTCAFLLVQLRWVERRTWRTSVLTAFLAATTSFVVFRVLLKVPLPVGLLPIPRGW